MDCNVCVLTPVFVCVFQTLIEEQQSQLNQYECAAGQCVSELHKAQQQVQSLQAKSQESEANNAVRLQRDITHLYIKRIPYTQTHTHTLSCPFVSLSLSLLTHPLSLSLSLSLFPSSLPLQKLQEKLIEMECELRSIRQGAQSQERTIQCLTDSVSTKDNEVCVVYTEATLRDHKCSETQPGDYI